MADFKELYDLDPYRKEFDAIVVSCTEHHGTYEVILDQTAFYPEGGGQPADHGTLNNVNVLDVHEKVQGIIHTCDAPLTPGEKVHGTIDWDRRFDFMQNHSGEHIVSGLIHKMTGFDNVGFHMGEVIQIDFSGPLSEDQMCEIEIQANRIVMRNEPVKALFPSADELETIDFRSKKELSGVVRLIEIEDADLCACCGTHVRNTGEIGLIKLLSMQKHKKGVRIEMLSGMRAFRYVQKAMSENHKVSVALSAKELETSEAVNALLKTSELKDVRIREVSESLLKYRLNEYESGQKLIIDFEDDLDRNVLRRHGNDLAEKAETAAVISGDETKWNYFIISKTVNLKDKAKLINEALNGRGGGSAEMIQGSFAGEKEKIETELKRILG